MNCARVVFHIQRGVAMSNTPLLDLFAESEISYGVDVIAIDGQLQSDGAAVITGRQCFQIQQTLEGAGLFVDKLRHTEKLAVGTALAAGGLLNHLAVFVVDGDLNGVGVAVGADVAGEEVVDGGSLFQRVGYPSFFHRAGIPLFIPILTVVILSIGGRMRMTRTNMLEVLNSDYIRTARAKGLKESVVIYKHAFRNTMIPLVTSLAGLLPGLFSGAIITEQVFGLPGIGNVAFDAMLVADIPFIMGYNMFLALLSVIGVLLADLMYAVVDPRVKLS